MDHPNPENIEEVNVSSLRFLGSQDGAPESRLKAKLVEVLKDDRNVRAAYLAKVAYGDAAQTSVALCLSSSSPNEATVSKAGSAFASMFGAHEHLDFLFLSNDQEKELAKVCAPFFLAKS
jgi:hypothetical protein